MSIPLEKEFTYTAPVARENSVSHPDDIEVPETLTPAGVHFSNLLVFGAIWIALALLFLRFSENGLVWASFLTVVAVGASIISEVTVVEPPDWHAVVLFDPLSKTRRAVFQGLHAKRPWERRDGRMTNLKREIPTRPNADTKFTLPTNDPTETMEVDLVVHTRLETSGTPRDDAQRLIRFNSVEEEDRSEIIDAEVRKMFAEYYGENEMENLLKASKIQKAVIVDNPDNHARIHQLGKDYGVHIGVVLRSSNPDERTKKLKETRARTEALEDAIAILTSKGMDPELARRTALLLDSTAEFSEAHYNLGINATGLEHLRDVTIIPPGAPGNAGKKKGGGK